MKKNYSLILLCMFLSMPALLNAATTKFYAQDFSISPGEETEFTIYFEGDVYVTQAQFYLDIPDGFEFVNKGTERRPVYAVNTDVSTGLTLTANLVNEGKQLRVVMTDNSQIGTDETSGELAKVHLKAKADVAVGNYTLSLTEMVASDENAATYYIDNQDVKASVITYYSVTTAVNDATYGSNQETEDTITRITEEQARQ